MNSGADFRSSIGFALQAIPEGARESVRSFLLLPTPSKSSDLQSSFNQATVEYNATTEEKVDVLRQRQDEIRERLREKS